MMYWDGGTAWWAVLLMWTGMVAFWGALIWLVWYLVRPATPRRDSTVPSSPEHILDERFARGDIDTEEYRTRREVLRSVAERPPTTAATGR